MPLHTGRSTGFHFKSRSVGSKKSGEAFSLDQHSFDTAYQFSNYRFVGLKGCDRDGLLSFSNRDEHIVRALGQFRIYLIGEMVRNDSRVRQLLRVLLVVAVSKEEHHGEEDQKRRP